MPHVYEVAEKFTIIFYHIVLIVFLPILICWALQSVKDYERLVILRLGRLRGGPHGPGLIFMVPFLDEYFLLDLRVVTYDVPSQEILSKDSVTVYVNAVIYYKVVNPELAVLTITDYRNGTEQLGATTLRNILGTKSLSDILADKESISAAMQLVLDEATLPWGVHVERVEIKDVSLPEAMQRAMAAEGEANREARAKVVAAEGELNASQALMEASNVISDNPATLQLRYLQTLNQISSEAEQNETIVFPLPLDLMNRFFS